MRLDFVQDVKKRKKNIPVVKIVKDVMTKKRPLPRVFLTGFKNILTKKNYK